jgi:hypothetical protein
MLTFQEKDHRYFWDGIEVPSVSQVMKTLGISKDWGATPQYYRDRGIAVAKAIELFLKGTLDESSLDPVIVPYLEQFKSWLQGNPKLGGLVLSEEKYYSKKLAYAGRIDLVINKSIWDVKCSKKFDKESLWQYQLQGCAYRQLMEENFGVDLPFKLLQLDGSNEKAKVIELTGKKDLWTHAMELYNAKSGRI